MCISLPMLTLASDSDSIILLSKSFHVYLLIKSNYLWIYEKTINLDKMDINEMLNLQANLINKTVNDLKESNRSTKSKVKLNT